MKQAYVSVYICMYVCTCVCMCVCVCVCVSVRMFAHSHYKKVDTGKTYLVAGCADKRWCLIFDIAIRFHMNSTLASVLRVSKVHDFRAVVCVQDDVFQLKITVE